ncbi:MAG: hypothetical protein VYE77_06560 [Planctomycetota bacterium]|nr:hypothetical protein [Planctomycetota bacterium]
MKGYKDNDSVRFVFVYQREPHARQMAFRDIPQPKTYGERVALARKTLDELNLDMDVWIDDLGDQSRFAFGDLPSWVVVVRPNGEIWRKAQWPEPEILEKILQGLDEVRQPHHADLSEERFLALMSIAQPKDPFAKDIRSPQSAEQVIVEAKARHHRHVMLAYLVEQNPDHENREAWLNELAGTDWEPQRKWAQAQQNAAKPPDESKK